MALLARLAATLRHGIAQTLVVAAVWFFVAAPLGDLEAPPDGAAAA